MDRPPEEGRHGVRLATISARDGYKLLVSTVVPRPIAWMMSQDSNGQLNAAPFSRGITLTRLN
jgi:flavin reductase (DIM6/NTAB) family NADH-FMN oxidoreductase RutF